ncbi:MAG: 23S rRNA (pseudouridine(1915)-N(3))-methyltransferase RlmH [Halieaceae bacterium]
MKLTLLALGTRMPGWVEQGIAEYHKRFPPELKLELRELPLAPRGKDSNPTQAIARETAKVREAMPARDRLVVLDVTGRSFSTEQLAQRLSSWQMSGQNYSLVIGGPDGVESSLIQEAELCWSLSPLTLPHPLVRVLLVEQLYRAWTINAGHPYHRS